MTQLIHRPLCQSLAALSKAAPQQHHLTTAFAAPLTDSQATMADYLSAATSFLAGKVSSPPKFPDHPDGDLVAQLPTRLQTIPGVLAVVVIMGAVHDPLPGHLLTGDDALVLGVALWLFFQMFPRV